MFPLPQPTRKNQPGPKYFIAKPEMIFVFCAIKLGMKMQEKALY